MRINGVTYGKLKTPLKVNGNLKSCKELAIHIANRLQWSKQVTVVTGRATKIPILVKRISGNHLETSAKDCCTWP